METYTATAILILVDQESTARHWADMVRGLTTTLWFSLESVPEHAEPELILTDCDLPDDLRERFDLNCLGIVRIGDSDEADVCLGDDATQRELHLACRLLVQVVRLRRRLQTGAELHRLLWHKALTDSLTGLANRRAWDQTLANQQVAPCCSEGYLCLALLDLDHFKHVNDRHSHAVGDTVLQATAKAMMTNLRQVDIAARLGGDEFGLLLHVPEKSIAMQIVDRVRCSVAECLATANLPVITASAGYHLVDRGPDASPLPSPTLLYSVASKALHEAKQSGRNRTCSSSALK